MTSGVNDGGDGEDEILLAVRLFITGILTVDNLSGGNVKDIQKWVAAVIALSLIVGYGSHAASPIASGEIVLIGFAGVIDDDEVIGLVEEYGVTPTAILVHYMGISGTHASYESIEIRKLIMDGRALFMSASESSLETDPGMMKHFLNRHSEIEIANSRALQSQARSLLNLRSQYERSIAYLKAEHPIIYAIEVRGERSQLDRLRTAPQVKVFLELSNLVTLRSASEETVAVKPPAYNAPFVDPVLNSLSPRELRPLITEVASGRVGNLRELLNDVLRSNP